MFKSIYISKRLSNTNNNFYKKLNPEIKLDRARVSSKKGQNFDSTNKINQKL
jgi:hypothetical protein